MTVHTLVESPLGPLTLVVDGDKVTGLYMEGQRHLLPAWSSGPHAGPGADLAGPGADHAGPGADHAGARPHNVEAGGAGLAEAEAPGLAAAARQLRDYFAGELTEFSLSLRLEGSPFRRQVWEALRRHVPYGEVVTYGELASLAGRPGAARAVGMAVGHNPISIIVPCHRVIGAGGALTGYAGGIDRKRWLLALEARSCAGGSSRCED